MSKSQISLIRPKNKKRKKSKEIKQAWRITLVITANRSQRTSMSSGNSLMPIRTTFWMKVKHMNLSGNFQNVFWTLKEAQILLYLCSGIPLKSLMKIRMDISPRLKWQCWSRRCSRRIQHRQRWKRPIWKVLTRSTSCLCLESMLSTLHMILMLFGRRRIRMATAC